MLQEVFITASLFLSYTFLCPNDWLEYTCPSCCEVRRIEVVYSHPVFSFHLDFCRVPVWLDLGWDGYPPPRSKSTNVIGVGGHLDPDVPTPRDPRWVWHLRCPLPLEEPVTTLWRTRTDPSPSRVSWSRNPGTPQIQSELLVRTRVFTVDPMIKMFHKIYPFFGNKKPTPKMWQSIYFYMFISSFYLRRL